MASEAALGEDGFGPEPDFSLETFTTRRDPFGEMIHTFSNLYIDSGEEEEKICDDVQETFPPPPPLEVESVDKSASPTITSMTVERLSE